MNNRRPLYIGLGLVLAAIILVGLFLMLFEKVETEITTDYSAEALRNPFLAAQRYLTAQDIPTESLRGEKSLQHLPATGDTLLVTYNHTFEQAKRREQLLDWIRDGGHLIMELQAHSAVNHDKPETPLLDQFGVYPEKSRDMLNVVDILRNVIDADQVEVQVYQENASLKIEFAPQYLLKVTQPDAALFSIKDKHGVHLVEYELGSGLLTLISDMDLWRNKHIGELDHAAFFSHILGFRHGKVWMVTGIEMPSLMDLIWQNAPQAVIAVLILLLLTLWYLYDRFGPVLVVERHQRRSLIEHLDAVAQFNWRYSRSEIPLKAMRTDLLRLLEKRCPRWHKMSHDQHVEWISTQTKLPETTIRVALFEPCDQASRFTRIAADLQTIRDQL